MSEKARELLERAMESLDGGFLYRLELKEEIREYLNHFPDATKMVAVEEEKQEEEPVSDNDLILVERGLIGAACAAIAMRRYAPRILDMLRNETMNQLKFHPSPHFEQRKPLTEEEIDQELLRNDYYSRSFTAGVRWAEKMHKIGVGDE